MKLNKWLYGAAALAMLAACSDKDIAPGSGGEDNGVTGPEVSGYISVQINLPQEVGSTRTEMNDQFDDGTPDEYNVTDARIILFKGNQTDGEKKAKYYRTQKLVKPFFENKPSTDQITSSYLAAIQVSAEPGANDNFWALVMLNTDNLKITEGTAVDGESTIKTITIGGETFSEKSTFEDFLGTIVKSDFYKGADGEKNTEFFMTNAPLSVARGGVEGIAQSDKLNPSSIRYLTNLGGAESIFPTMEEAKNHVAGCVYVERAVAKVTAQLAQNPFKMKFYSGEKNADGSRKELQNVDVKVNSVRYALTNRNTSSYLIRNVEFKADSHFKWSLSTNNVKETNDYRMVGSELMPKLKSPFHNKDQEFYRTYWCLDPNYDTPMKEAVINGEGTVTQESEKSLAGIANLKSIDKTLYCRENTFTVQYQNHGNSTLAIFEIDFDITVGGKKVDHLFIKDGNKEVIFLSKEDAAYDEISRIVNDPLISDALKASLKDGVTDLKITDIRPYLDIKIEREKVLNENGDEVQTQNLIIKSVTLKVPENDPYFDASSVDKFAAYLATDNRLKDLLDNINILNDVTEYTNSVSYYVVPIKHFGDYYCPWSGKGINTKDVYNEGQTWSNDLTHAEKYLGRYGTVRNNWYDLTISGIKALGSPTFPEIDLTLSDDNEEDKKYFAVEIHILSWAKRTQNVDF